MPNYLISVELRALFGYGSISLLCPFLNLNDCKSICFITPCKLIVLSAVLLFAWYAFPFDVHSKCTFYQLLKMFHFAKDGVLLRRQCLERHCMIAQSKINQSIKPLRTPYKFTD